MRVAGVVAGVGGFGSAIRDSGLDGALGHLGLEELRGRSAADVAAAISERLTRDADGLDAEFLQSALMDAMLEAASLGEETGYHDFAEGMEAFIGAQGPEGLVELFLQHFVFDTLWARIEQHAVDRSPDAAAFESLMAAVKGECDVQVRDQLQTARDAGTFERIDWFGRAGRDVGMRVVTELESRLAALRET